MDHTTVLSESAVLWKM